MEKIPYRNVTLYCLYASLLPSSHAYIPTSNLLYLFYTADLFTAETYRYRWDSNPASRVSVTDVLTVEPERQFKAGVANVLYNSSVNLMFDNKVN